MPLLKIVKLLVILGLTFWFGVFALAGVVFVVSPFSIPSGLNHLKLPFAHTFWVGVALLLIAWDTWYSMPCTIAGRYGSFAGGFRCRRCD